MAVKISFDIKAKDINMTMKVTVQFFEQSNVEYQDIKSIDLDEKDWVILYGDYIDYFINKYTIKQLTTEREV